MTDYNRQLAAFAAERGVEIVPQSGGPGVGRKDGIRRAVRGRADIEWIDRAHRAMTATFALSDAGPDRATVDAISERCGIPSEELTGDILPELRSWELVWFDNVRQCWQRWPNVLSLTVILDVLRIFVDAYDNGEPIDDASVEARDAVRDRLHGETFDRVLQQMVVEGFLGLGHEIINEVGNLHSVGRVPYPERVTKKGRDFLAGHDRRLEG